MLQRFISQRPGWAWAALIFLLGFVQFANTLGHEYAWDDDIVIVYNQRVQQGFSAIPSLFEFRERQEFQDFTGYRPVAMSSFAIDVGLFGMNPHASHAVNVILFALASMVLFFTLRQVFPKFHPVFAFLVTLLYLVHPLHVEAVANIKSRDEILSMLFAMLSLQMFVRHYRTGNWWTFGASAIFLTLGALSKEGALTFLLVIPLTVLVIMEGTWRKKLVAILKFPAVAIVLVAVFFLLTGHAPGASTPVTTKAFVENQILGNCMATPIPDAWQRIGNVSYMLWQNVLKFFYPRDLVYFSGYNMYPVMDWTLDRTPLTIGWSLLIIVTTGLTVFMRRLRTMTYGWYFFLATVVIYIQLPFFLLADTIADRFMFTPSIGLTLLVVDGLYRLLRVDPHSNPLEAIGKDAKGLPAALRTRALLLTVATAILAIGLSAGTLARNRVWHDNMTLFSTDLPKLENCARAHYYYASEVVKREMQSGNPQDRDLAIQHYRRAIEISQESYYAYYRLAANYERWEMYAEEVKLMEEALKRYPGQADLWNFKGRGLYFLKKFAEAVPAFDQARLQAPDYDDVWEMLARSQERSGQYEAAFKTLDEAIGRNSAYLMYYDALSDTYFDSGDTAQSFVPLQVLLERDGNNPVWWRKVIGRYQIIGNNAAAGQYYQQALAKGLQL